MITIPDQLKKKRYLAIVGGVLVLVAALFFGSLSPVAALSQIEVEGTTGRQADKVRQAANLEPGTPLVKINENEVAARVQDVPTVASVQVSRSWPNTVVIKVVERKPVAKVEIGAQEWEIIDSTGQAFRTTKKLPDLPTLEASVKPPFTNHGRTAGAQVLGAIPDWFKKRVTTAKANDPNAVRLLTDDNETIVWGTAEDSELKGQVLRILLKQKGMYWFDVRNPRLPTVAAVEPRPAKPPKAKKETDEKCAEGAESTEDVESTENTENTDCSPSPDPSTSPSASATSDPASSDSNSPDSSSPESNTPRRTGEPYLLP